MFYTKSVTKLGDLTVFNFCPSYGRSSIFAVLRLSENRDGQRAPPLVEVNQAIEAWSLVERAAVENA